MNHVLNPTNLPWFPHVSWLNLCTSPNSQMKSPFWRHVKDGHCGVRRLPSYHRHRAHASRRSDTLWLLNARFMYRNNGKLSWNIYNYIYVYGPLSTQLGNCSITRGCIDISVDYLGVTDWCNIKIFYRNQFLSRCCFFSTNMEEFELHAPWFWMVSMHQFFFQVEGTSYNSYCFGVWYGPGCWMGKLWENYGKWCLSKVLKDGISMDWNMLNLNGFNITGNWMEEGPNKLPVYSIWPCFGDIDLPNSNNKEIFISQGFWKYQSHHRRFEQRCFAPSVLLKSFKSCLKLSASD